MAGRVGTESRSAQLGCCGTGSGDRRGMILALSIAFAFVAFGMAVYGAFGDD
jgi:hypothetical protein